MTLASEISNKIEFIRELFLLLTWAEMERLAEDLEEWRTFGEEGQATIYNRISGDWLSDWAMNSEVK